jgi:hypothetical protein
MKTTTARIATLAASLVIGAGTAAAQGAPADSAANLYTQASERMAWGTPPDTAAVIGLLTQAATLYREAADRGEEAIMLALIGRLHTAAGRVDSALVYYRRASDLQRIAGDTAALSATLEEMQSPAAVELLNRSPLLKPTMGAVAGARYVNDTRALLTSTRDEGELQQIKTVEKATQELEQVLEKTMSVYAVVQSEPSRVEVTYRRLIQKAAPPRSLTTNDSILLRPALYLFEGKDPATGAAQRKPVACATRCKVDFIFTKGR